MFFSFKCRFNLFKSGLNSNPKTTAISIWIQSVKIFGKIAIKSDFGKNVFGKEMKNLGLRS